MEPTQMTIRHFESDELKARDFTHEAHIYVAWLYLCECETTEALERFDTSLRRLVTRLGVPDKYNAMVTWLFMKLIADRRREGENWQAFRTRNADLIDERPRAQR